MFYKKKHYKNKTLNIKNHALFCILKVLVIITISLQNNSSLYNIKKYTTNLFAFYEYFMVKATPT